MKLGTINTLAATIIGVATRSGATWTAVGATVAASPASSPIAA